MDKNWMDCGTFWINLNEQRTPQWHQARRGRVTASNFGTAIGDSKFSTPQQLADSISSITKLPVSERSQIAMDYGTQNEDTARQWYCQNYNKIVKEFGLAVPKYELRIGGSVDGVVIDDPCNIDKPWIGDGIIEIKCPMKMYEPLKNHEDKILSGWVPDQYYHDHIWKTHYDQMIGCMAILNKKWCDYIVYCIPENISYVEKIYFNQSYWDNYLYPKLTDFLDNILQPRLQQYNITIDIPKN